MDFSLKDVMEDYGFGIEEIKIRIPGVWGQRWLSTAGVLCGFFFHDVSTQRETVEEFAARFLPQGSASWRLSHLPLFKRHPDAGNTQKLILVCWQ